MWNSNSHFLFRGTRVFYVVFMEVIKHSPRLASNEVTSKTFLPIKGKTEKNIFSEEFLE